MMHVHRRPTDADFEHFGDWHGRACAARDALVRDWIDAGRPVEWQASIDKDLYREFRDVFLHRAFYLKCAYCEAKLGHGYPAQVEHYRPKGRVTDERESSVHPGYFWLAYEWWNLVPTCNHCNTWHKDPLSGSRSSGKSTKFPIRGRRVSEPSADPSGWQEELTAEEPLLLNPYLDDPEEHIEFDPETGAPIGTSLQGTATIEICDLKRASLCERRRDKGKDVSINLVLRLIEKQETFDSVIPPSSEYSLWLRCLSRWNLAKACVNAEMTEPVAVRRSQKPERARGEAGG